MEREVIEAMEIVHGLADDGWAMVYEFSRGSVFPDGWPGLLHRFHGTHTASGGGIDTGYMFSIVEAAKRMAGMATTYTRAEG